MAVTTSALVTRVQGLSRPISSVSSTEIEAALVATAQELSRISPQRKAVSLTLADGVGDLSTMTGWVDGVSQVTAVEYPKDYVPRAILHPALWDQREDYTIKVYAATTEAVRVYFHTDHLVTDSDSTGTTTYSVVEGEAAAHLAAAQILEGLAARWGQAQSVSVAGDEYAGPSPSNLESTAGAFRERAQRLLSPASVVIGFEAAGYGFTPDPF